MKSVAANVAHLPPNARAALGVGRFAADQIANAAKRAAANYDDDLLGGVVAAAGDVLGGGADSDDSGDGGAPDNDLFSAGSGDDT